MQAGYRVVEAANGLDCLAIYQQHRPDMVLLDGLMPVMDGFACCRQLRALNQEQRQAASQDYSPPILMITGLNDSESVDQAFEAGATDYVTKPIHWPVLRMRVRRLLQASNAIEALQQQTEQERVINAITQQIRQSLNLDEVLSTAAREVQQFLKADRVVIEQLQPDHTRKVAMESLNPDYPSILGKTIPPQLLDRAGLDHSITAIEDIATSDLAPAQKELFEQLQVKARLMVPIWQRQQIWGLLIAHQCSGTRRWSPAEINLVERLAVQVAIAIQQSQLYEQLTEVNQELQRLAAVDGLTQVHNRRSFDERMLMEWQRLRREQRPLSLILGDVDYFKSYNDTYGHQAGDDCLKQLAHTLERGTRRQTDLVARYGGEEFAVILPNTPAAGAREVAEQIQAQIQGLDLPHIVSPLGHVTMSLGVATMIPTGGQTLEDLIAMADKALYQAKLTGRSRICQETISEYPENNLIQ